VTSGRHTAYKEVLRCLELLPLRDGEIAVARDAAEGFLLTAGEDTWEMAELRLGVAIVLDRAVSAHRISREVADDLVLAIERCGPETAVPVAA
jgi:hypothetical protein